MVVTCSFHFYHLKFYRDSHTAKFPGFPGSYLNFPDYLRTPPTRGRGYLAPLALRIYYPDTVFFAGAYGATISSISKSGLRAANCWNRTIFVIQVSSFESNHTPRNKNLRFVNGIAVACCSVNSEILLGVVNLCFFSKLCDGISATQISVAGDRSRVVDI